MCPLHWWLHDKRHSNPFKSSRIGEVLEHNKPDDHLKGEYGPVGGKKKNCSSASCNKYCTHGVLQLNAILRRTYRCIIQCRVDAIRSIICRQLLLASFEQCIPDTSSFELPITVAKNSSVFGKYDILGMYFRTLI